MNSKSTFIVISDHLFRKGPRPLVTVSTADISVLHSAEVVHFQCESCSPYARVCKAPKHYQGEQTWYTMKPFKGLSNKLGLLDSLGKQI
jgi:hypothetical protein